MAIYEHSYFSSINTYEKAYILGLIIFNIKENCSDKIIIEINLKKEKITNYEYYKNIDKIIEIFKKLGKVQFNCDTSTIELTISSLYIIKDIFTYILLYTYIHTQVYHYIQEYTRIYLEYIIIVLVYFDIFMIYNDILSIL